MKTVFRITAILDMLLVVLADVCAAVAVINKRADLLVVSTPAALVSIFLTVLMIVLCNDFKGADK